MENYNSQNGQKDAVPAVVLDFNNDTTEGSTLQYPQALPAAALVPPPPTPSAPAKKLDDSGEEASSHPRSEGPVPPTGPRDFSDGIFDCANSWSICADACCCTYCIVSAQHNLIVNEQEGIFWPLCCGLLCVDVGLTVISPYLPSSLFFHTCFMRHALRQRYHLRSEEEGVDRSNSSGGGSCNKEFVKDFLTVCFCLSCVIAQHQREILQQGDWCGGVLSDRHALQAPGTTHTV
ncbi:hypothetical protein ABB37_09660 [Leptomonas pyrrhocoris]|uniref:PLAC8 family protein n=1 Tax=Leptomonas pyrrhocoris TaxID=157538 RepID=A0A0M9FQF3_LEPPY|nr:hypothetical protein ABB37_09660 [Leptomonas pyrrhocoris]XP_015652206.1 hypothetical protein ABB37_09660 [Leptomonas pyrrhocoris]XP_015652207.1 hypothetical protein ABB37_09660 [Leptomonas pyrrhocoris]KPA73766.1 hypothetical protein ABB37_09660 [Leptomonas pyrrhocoris]KPA73767.1 hypothetical protein ABB37_09660 [Leptomonas pyrrhocoris]KPA73768.1 hypothetical protein ABB37_09660 [Leptomonas pyrrhocoris]|eukprot:XP_015652205.1 hypothetical protein ABB37_09660 [Leptomonas pyrrhocoris]